MGGNALKNCVTRRYTSLEYFLLTGEVHSKLAWCFNSAQFDFIKAYATKESYGDMDIVINSADITEHWVDYVIEEFKPKEWIKNGNVLSFEYKEFQIDLIMTHPDEYQTSLNYFAYNDLGNLLGRIAHSMGLKLGHDGLSYNWRVESYQFKNEIISTNWEEICNVLGVSYERYMQGFDTLEDIFKFVVASPFFHSDIYLLENRNNYARTRDKKHKTYTEFLKWIEGYSHTNDQLANKIARDGFSKDIWLSYQFSVIDGFEATYKRVQAEWAEETEYKKRYNGDIVRSITGLQNQELGMFMKWMKETHDQYRMRRNILQLNPHVIPSWITYNYEQYKKETGK